mmetsp:Transcript_2501/g.4205  ORF Transcript_2501/g.4205 Transcript_2501/m.4205 type:complete len:96 (-) Transcript_2501:203-490(-)|eukprot:CAMPEP_0184994932 /NCGR_PEP_ID=MMETSP1098-20130426/51310_1 /TAXON_ID=89044 /ORGANISM="Spumella elongata, Strain CCAP 955/1" /LENGTH=95 /DNA_ID=CAMNT_0027521107 /DNA_START=58 /DNA_END=345 /DNA_ORIENTATION=+
MSSAVKNILASFSTTPNDKKHFPATNQAHYCWQRYNEFVLCLKKSEGDAEACAPARHLAISLCPEDWINNWDEQRENGNFLGVQEKAAAADDHHH